MKYVLFVSDGMADLPIAQLNGKTVLEHIICTNMSKLASAGKIGSVQTVPITMQPGTDTAFHTIMGYEVEKTYTGRAALEAVGAGLKLRDDEIAFRCNLSSITQTSFDMAKMLSHSAFNIDHNLGYAIMEWLINQPDFAKELNQLGIRIEVGYGFRHIAILSNKYKYDMAKDFNIVPPHDIVGKDIRDYIKPITNTNRLIWRLMRKSNEVLARCPYNEQLVQNGYNPANCIWLWGAGTKPNFVSMVDRYGIHGAAISAVPIVNGIANLCGLTPIAVEGATGDKHTNYNGKALAAVDVLVNKGYDFVLVHVEAPDECSHDGDLEGKMYAVKQIDEMLKTIATGLSNQDFRLLFMADHITSIDTRTHDWGSVPYLIYDSRFYQDRNITFDENSVNKYGEELKFGYKLLDILLER